MLTDRIGTHKGAGLLLFTCIYVLAYISGFVAGELAETFVLQMLLFDLAATAVIWAVSLVLRNSSLYDAYWSLTPMVMTLYGVSRYSGNFNLYHWIFISVFMLWSARLTVNWVITFEKLSWEDWRYRQLRGLPAPLWHLANFFGIMLAPTLFVFAGIIPVFYFLTLKSGALSLIGSAVVLCGTALEFVADRQMHRFLRETTEKKTCRTGLWRYSRHPNYLGEILVWVGAYLTAVCTDTSLWYLCGGVGGMVFLFNAISVPLAEKRHLSRRPDYVQYRAVTSKLLLLPYRGER